MAALYLLSRKQRQAHLPLLQNPTPSAKRPHGAALHGEHAKQNIAPSSLHLFPQNLPYQTGHQKKREY